MNKLIYIILLLSLCSCSQSVDKPNIIIIYADDLGYGDLSSYGGNIPTPNIDRIGEDGIRFTDFYVAAPVCTPSRFSLLTGSYPNRSKHQLDKVLFPFDKGHLDKSETILAEYLKREGYATAIMGKWHLGLAEKSYYPTNHGFEEFYGHLGGCIDYFYHTYGKIGVDWYENTTLCHDKGYATDLITEHAIDFINGQVKKNSQPFFLYLPFNAPHYGKSDPDSLPDNTIVINEGKYKDYETANTLQAPENYINNFSHIEDPYRQVYSAMVSNLDDNVGLLLKELGNEKLLENTMVWFISDNGGYSETHRAHANNGNLRGQKGSLWEGGIRVPALVFWKNKIESGQVINTPVANIDIVPTIGSIVGFANMLPDSTIDGIDLSPVLFEGENVERNIYWKRRNQSAIRRGVWKLVNGNELYNLKNDMEERINLAQKFPEKVKELQDHFDTIDSTIYLKEI